MKKKLYLVNGQSAVGKSYLWNFADRHIPDVAAIKKYTTRPRRNNKDRLSNNDVIYLTEHEFKSLDLDFVYMFSGYSYGFYTKDIISKLDALNMAILILRDWNIIKKVEMTLNQYRIKKVLLTADKNLRIKRLCEHGYSKYEILQRINRDTIVPVDNSYEFNSIVIINNSTKLEFQKRINQLFSQQEINNR